MPGGGKEHVYTDVDDRRCWLRCREQWIGGSVGGGGGLVQMVGSSSVNGLRRGGQIRNGEGNSRHGWYVHCREAWAGEGSGGSSWIVGKKGLWRKLANGGRSAGAYGPGKSSRTPGRGWQRERREVINVQGEGREKCGERGIYIGRQLLAVSFGLRGKFIKERRRTRGLSGHEV